MEPSIYAADFSQLGDQLDGLLAAGARIFHFDVGDGHFVSEITIGPVVLRSISKRVHAAGGVLDCHLMVSDPEAQFERIKEAGGDSVTFHAEVVDDAAEPLPHVRGRSGSRSASPSTRRRTSSGRRPLLRRLPRTWRSA